jgi:hypothetical protein
VGLAGVFGSQRARALGIDAGRGMIAVRPWWGRPEQCLELSFVRVLVDAADGMVLKCGDGGGWQSGSRAHR